MHSLGQRARFVPKLPRPPRCALKGMILPWTQDPPVCHDILEVDRDILVNNANEEDPWIGMSWYPTCGSWHSGGLSRSIDRLSPDRGVELMSKLVLWTTPFSKKIVLDVQNYSVELKQLGRVERQELYPDIVHFQWDVYSVHVEARWYFLGGNANLQIFWFELGYHQIKLRPTYLNVLVWPILMPHSGEIWVYRLGVSG